MKQNLRHPLGGKLRGLFCLGLAAVLAAGVALNSAAANAQPAQYDVKVVSAFTHTAILSNGDLYFLGTNDMGQFPDSDLTYSPQPVQLADKAADVAVSANRTLVVSQDGVLRLYGVEPTSMDASGQDGQILAKDAAQAAASETFAAYVTKAGALYTWGRNDFGQLGTGNTEDSETPVQVFESGVKKVSLGNTFALALMDDGSVYGWGSDSFQEIGYLEEGQPVESVPTPVKVAEDAADIATGEAHSCILKNDGTLWTCGDNTYGQTGVGSDSDAAGLVQIMTGVRSVSAGSSHNFAISTDGAVYAWGYGVSGQLGAGNSERAETPVETTFDYVQVFACDDNTFGVSSDGSIYSFGGNTNYLLGKTDGSDSLSPVRILDKEMNYVYQETLDDHYHAAEGPSTTADTPTESDVPVETAEPEIVTTPFVSGYTDGAFRPENNVTRAEFVRMLVSALCKEYDPKGNYGTCSFKDIPLNQWYEKYVAYAEGESLVSGYTDGTFHPNSPITRAEASSIIAKALELDVAAAPDAGFTDVSSTYWAAGAINALAAEDVLHGDGDGKFNPDANLTRAEAATALAQAASFRPDDARVAELKELFPTVPFEDVPASAWYYVYILRALGYVE